MRDININVLNLLVSIGIGWYDLKWIEYLLKEGV
jgi:hypothetical protein